ncbi:hypothetical protein [Fictibacillus norfolkensis]|uniref:Uncharacterized protein n=1 Tax=Fictibacillus norfolkensis TaxID=2762233 RepID=A0ABR8SPJ7_9BACL|nr:hypothetical protein [Fictibacillus norfolkensis]MBD7965381.1 hypothetical protein [Fictibacillus norfolkensis]
MEDWISKVGWSIAILGTMFGLWVCVSLGVDPTTGSLTNSEYGEDHPLKVLIGIFTILVSLFAGSLLIGLATLMDFARQTLQENKRNKSA